MCDMDIDINYDIEPDSDMGYELENDVGFEGLESVDDIDYEAFDTSEEPEYSIDIFTDAAFTNIDMEEEFEAVEEENVDIQLAQVSLDELSDELPEVRTDIEAEIVASPEEIVELIDSGNDTEYLENLRDALQSGRIAVETVEAFNDEGSPKVLTREITPELSESREEDIEEVLNNYRDNLRGYGVEEDRIEDYINQEREKICVEYESLDRGEISSNIYYQPENWEDIAVSLSNQEVNSDFQETEEENTTDNIHIQESEQLGSEIQEQNIDYAEIYEDIQQESLEEGFENIEIDSDPEGLESSLENFDESTWEGLSLDEQKNAMSDLANYVVDIVGFDNPPMIEYYNNPQEGDFGGYDPDMNILHVNEYMLYNSNEAADTIAHELWHAHQHECAMNPHNARDYQYQYNFENYIPPALGQEAYENQLVEAEARAFAEQFKGRISNISGRSREWRR